MVLAKKQLSKVVAIVLVAMCAVAFMPLLNGQAFAAAKAKKPAKVTVQSAKQVSGTYKVKVTWKKAKNAKKYNVKIDKKVVKKNVTKLTYTSAALKAGKHKVYVQAVNGKKKGKWSKAKAVTVKPVPASVEIVGIPAVGETLTAIVYDKNGKEITSGVTYQWYRTGANTGGDNPIAGATSAEYTVVKADQGKPLYVTAKAVGKEVKAAETAMIGSEPTFFIANVNPYHTVPVVGDTMKIGLNVDGEFDSWLTPGMFDCQWFADGAAINNATGVTYTVYKTDVDKALSVELTRINPDQSTTVYNTEPTEKVIEGTLPTAARLVGMSTPAEYNKDGSLKTAGTPAVGDTLSVEFTKPANAADEGATYQWTRGGVAISGATSASYTVKDADLGKVLSVKITRSDKVAVADADVEAVNAVKKNFGAATVTLAKAEATTAGNIDTFTATVKIGTTAMTLNTDYTLAWYADAVSEENQLFKPAGTPVADATVGGVDEYFIGKDATKATSLAGKTLFAVATGTGEYTGTAQGVAASAATKAVAIEKTIKANALSGGKVVAGVTTLEAAVDPADADVSFQWSSKTADADFAPVSGATKASYVPTVADSEAGVTAYSVTIASTVAYRVLTNASTSDAYAFTWYDGGAVVIAVDQLNITDTTAERGGYPSGSQTRYVQAGDVLEASSNVSSADANLTFTWTLRNAKNYQESSVIKTAEGPTFTVPSDVAKGTYISLSAVSNNPKYEVTAVTNQNANATDVGFRWAQVQGTYAVALSSDKDKYNAAGDLTFDGVAHPVVGAKISAQVLDGKTAVTDATLTWTVDGEVVKNGAGSYTLAAKDFGKTLVVTAENGNGYAGTVASAETGVIGAEARIAVTGTRGGAAITDINGQLKVGDVLNASTSVGDMEGVVYNWTIAEGENVVETATGSTLQIIDRYVGCSVYVEAAATNLMPPEGGSLTWLNDNAIGQ